MSSIRVLVVEDFAPFLEFICSTLREEPGLQIVGEVSDGLEAVRQAEKLKPDLILLVLPAKIATEIWKNIGVPLASLNQAAVMTAENCVDAALSGLDQGESATLPSVEDYKLWLNYEDARRQLFDATQTGKPASRYHVGLANAHSD
jgi:DNA-binding NarL/FixJ family response regulator